MTRLNLPALPTKIYLFVQKVCRRWTWRVCVCVCARKCKWTLCWLVIMMQAEKSQFEMQSIRTSVERIYFLLRIRKMESLACRKFVALLSMRWPSCCQRSRTHTHTWSSSQRLVSRVACCDRAQRMCGAIISLHPHGFRSFQSLWVSYICCGDVFVTSTLCVAIVVMIVKSPKTASNGLVKTQRKKKTKTFSNKQRKQVADSDCSSINEMKYAISLIRKMLPQ